MGLDPRRVKRIVEKAEFVEQSLAVLADKQSVSRAQYHDRPETRDIVERRFEKVTQASIDIARMLLGDCVDTVPEANAAVVLELGEQGILTSDTADRMATAATFRNVLAHEYGDVLDHDIVYDALQDLERYRDFLHEIRDYLTDSGAI